MGAAPDGKHFIIKHTAVGKFRLVEWNSDTNKYGDIGDFEKRDNAIDAMKLLVKPVEEYYTVSGDMLGKATKE